MLSGTSPVAASSSSVRRRDLAAVAQMSVILPVATAAVVHTLVSAHPVPSMLRTRDDIAREAT